MSKYPEWLTGRYFGGSFVADTPGNAESAGNWPEGDSAPGARECCNLLVDICNSPISVETPVFVFLIGGAGNGKSYLAKDVTNSLKGSRVDRRGTFASRTYEYELENGGTLYVVNDATIPPKKTTEKRDYLIKDISGALEVGSSMLACVNRGILVSEANVVADGESDDYRLARTLVRWLLLGEIQREEGDEERQRLNVPDGLRSRDYYTFCTIRGPDGDAAYVHVVFMDQCSLFEPFPTINVGNSGEDRPILSPEMPKLEPISRESRAHAILPGKEVLSGLYSQIERETQLIELPGGDLDPVKANIQCLSDRDVLHGVCNIVRAAEVISGNHLTYRDAWGLSVIALLGPIPAEGLRDYELWVAARAEEAGAGAIDERLKAVTRLAMRRTHMTLFSTSGPEFLFASTEQPTYPSVQAMESMAMADPVVCLSEDINKAVKDKLTLLDEEKGPGQALAEQDEIFKKVWTDLDQQLEDTLLAWLYATEEGPKSGDRNEALSWYGQYLARLYALARGKPAYEAQINYWQETWLRASSGTLRPVNRLSEGLHRLLFTPFNEDRDETFLPVFSSRVSPITSGQDGKGVALSVPTREYHWEHQVLGSSIIMMLKKYSLGDAYVSRFILDFAMLRETDAKSEGSGFTEGSIDVEPRVERVRAGILAAEMQQARESGAPPEVVFVDGAVTIR